jgi:prefoldin alpha subunit
MEALAAVEALQGISDADDGTVLLQIGGGASLRVKVLEPDKVLLNIGAEVIVERTNKDSVEFLKDRITEMEASEKKVVETLDRLRSQMNEITKRLEQGYQQAVQAEQQYSPPAHGEED